jgi:hypothetical protein
LSAVFPGAVLTCFSEALDGTAVEAVCEKVTPAKNTSMANVIKILAVVFIVVCFKELLVEYNH